MLPEKAVYYKHLAKNLKPAQKLMFFYLKSHIKAAILAAVLFSQYHSYMLYFLFSTAIFLSYLA
jgi:hypothetical protein